MLQSYFEGFGGASRYRRGGRRQWLGAGVETRELEDNQRASDPMILAFKIPEAPYSDDIFEKLHKTFEVTHGVMATLEIFEADLVALGGFGLGLTVLGPLAAFAAGFMSLGAGYVEGRAKISRDRVKMGFAEGFAAGADSRTWKFVKSLFWEGRPEF